MSAVATIGTGLSRGCRRLGITPFLVAEATSQAEFSMNHPGHRKAIGNDNSLRACSMIVCCESRYAGAPFRVRNVSTIVLTFFVFNRYAVLSRPAMRFIWDENKNRQNLRKHDVRFETAVLVFDDPYAITQRDVTFEDEERWITVGVIGPGSILVIVHTFYENTMKKLFVSSRLAPPSSTKGEPMRKL